METKSLVLPRWIQWFRRRGNLLRSINDMMPESLWKKSVTQKSLKLFFKALLLSGAEIISRGDLMRSLGAWYVNVQRTQWHIACNWYSR